MFYVLFAFVTYLLTLPRTYVAPKRKAMDFTSFTLIVLYENSYVLSKPPAPPPAQMLLKTVG
jgi:hypothetical protein